MAPSLQLIAIRSTRSIRWFLDKTVSLFPVEWHATWACTNSAPNLATATTSVGSTKSIAFGATLELQMANDIGQAQRSSLRGGPVDFSSFVSLGCDRLHYPIRALSIICDQQRIDWFIFGWDWRRMNSPLLCSSARFLPTIFRRAFNSNTRRIRGGFPRN